MIVCHCKAVSDRLINHSLRSGATTVDEVSEGTGAGSQCGRCRPVLHDLVDEAVGGCRGCIDCPALTRAA